MNYLGIDIEKNRKSECGGIWNVGIGLFNLKDGMVCGFNVLVQSAWSDDPKDGYGVKYFKSRNTINRAFNPIWCRTNVEADLLVSTLVAGMDWGASFGYNSNVFDLGLLEEILPKTYALLAAKTHIDLMPAALTYISQRKDYYEFWKICVELDLTHEGHPDYTKYSAELIVNYLRWKEAKKEGRTFKYVAEEHVGVEDLRDYEFPILEYFKSQKKKVQGLEVSGFQKWKWLSN